MRRLFLPLVALLALGAVLGLAPVAAHADATIESSPIENGYPKQLLFKLTASAPVEIKEVTLRYTVQGAGTSASGKPEEFTPGKSVTTSVKVDTSPNTNWIPAGVDITWHWELVLADGTTTVQPEQKFLYLPPGKEWKTAQNDIAVVYFYGARESLAAKFLDAIKGTYDEHGKTLLKTELPLKPVKLVLMGTSDELKEASPSKGTTLDNSRTVVTCGFRPGNTANLIFSTVQCGGSDPVDTVRHEFGHILNAAAGEGSLVKLPTWIEEGLAVYAQDNADDYVAAFSAATRSSRGLIPFRQMSQPVSDQNQVILQYGQGFMMTKYLIDTYGVPKLNQLLGLTKKNTRFDEALKTTYNFDIDGFEKEFTAAVTGARATPTAAPTVRPQQQTQPTVAPTSAPRPSAATNTSSSGDDFPSKTTVVIGGAVLMLLLLAVLAFLFMMMMQNQRTGGRPG